MVVFCGVEYSKAQFDELSRRFLLLRSRPESLSVFLAIRLGALGSLSEPLLIERSLFRRLENRIIYNIYLSLWKIYQITLEKWREDWAARTARQHDENIGAQRRTEEHQQC